VQSGIWPLYRYNPDLVKQGRNPLQLDSKDPTIPVKDYAYNESRYRSLVAIDENRAEKLMKSAQEDVNSRWELYKQMAAIPYSNTQTEQTGQK
jgi:pyruvate-ferredoxin/flavodoxin oxidoreductase